MRFPSMASASHWFVEASRSARPSYRYERKLSDENAQIADWLVRLTTNRRSWGFGLCFSYLRNVKGFEWKHKRVYRIYCELELRLRIKPKKRLKRPKPDELAVPGAPNQTWSMDFMEDQLADGRSFRTLNVLDDFNREGAGNRGRLLFACHACCTLPEPDHPMAGQACQYSS